MWCSLSGQRCHVLLKIMKVLLSYVNGRCDPLIASGHGTVCCLQGFLREATERIRWAIWYSGFFGRCGTRIETHDEQLWCQMHDWRLSVVFLHVGGNDISYEQQGHIGEMILELVRSMEAAGTVCIVGEILPRIAFRGNIEAVGFERDVR